MRRALIAIAIVLGSFGAARAEPPVEYSVQPGDTCISVATRVVGDRTAYKQIHLLNPQLGKLPHTLRPGQVLLIPARAAAAGPDATLTGARGEVKVRKPTDDGWTLAERGMDLYRAWRVGSAERASAELTFRDDSHLRMRERTIVILYGPERGRARVIAAEAELEQGALETRLGELGGRRVMVRTPNAEAGLGPGRAIVTLDGVGDSIIANHDGGEVEVHGAGLLRQRRPVAVPAGMGSKVKKGQPPGRPQLLPPAPAWVTTPRTFVALASRGGRVIVEWAAVDVAARYRLSITGPAGEDVDAIEVAAPATRGELSLPAGRYHVAVATIDGDGFESVASADLPVEVAAVTVVPPGGRDVLDDAPRGADPIVTAGTTLIGPEGWSCAEDGGASQPELLLARAGAGRTVGCISMDGSEIEPFVVDVTPIVIVADGRAIRVQAGERATAGLQVSSAAAIGPDLQVIGSDGVTVLSTTQAGGRIEVELDVTPGAPAISTLSIAVGGTAVSSLEIAVEPPPAPPPPPAPEPDEWNGTAEAGLVLTSGNSRTTTLTATAKVERTDPRHKIAAEAGLVYARSTVLAALDRDGDGAIGAGELAEDSSTTANNWNAKVRYDRVVDDSHALYAAVLAAADRPAGKDLVYGGQLGYSHRVKKGERHELVAELGYDVSYESLIAGTDVAIHSARGFAGYKGKVNDKTGVEVSLEVLANLNTLDTVPEPARPGDDTRLNAAASLTTELRDGVAFSFSFGVKLDAMPAPRPPFALPYAPGFVPVAERVDTITRAALIVSMF